MGTSIWRWRISPEKRRRGFWQERMRPVPERSSAETGAGGVHPASVPGCSGAAPKSPALRAGAQGHAASGVGECASFRKASAPFPALEGHRFGAGNAPHIFFCLGKRKRAAPGTKENRLFSGLLVRPEQMGLVSSSCAKRRAFPERSRRICFIGCKLEDAKRTRGPSCAAAARPGIRRRFLPAGAYTFFCCPLSGSGAVAESSPICTNRLLKAGQMRPKRHGRTRQ